jgi:serine/threonine protein kinase
MDHPNIVKFLYYDIEALPHRTEFYNLHSFIELMDFSLEENLKERRAASNPFSRTDIDGFLNCMANAMRYMQEVKNTAHLDIKPQNILIKGRSILID